MTEGEDLGGEAGPRGSEGNPGDEKESDHREHPVKIPGGRASEGAPAKIVGNAHPVRGSVRQPARHDFGEAQGTSKAAIRALPVCSPAGAHA